MVAHFERWAANPQVREWICRDWISPEERIRRLREIFGLAPEPPEEADLSAPGSNPVKPGQTESDPVQPAQTGKTSVFSDGGRSLVS